MKTKGRIGLVAAGLVAMAPPAWAVDTSQTYQSGFLVLLFLGVCALIVVAQMVPALILMLGAISGFAKKIAARKEPRLATVQSDTED